MSDKLFEDINDDVPVSEIESVCMQCLKNGSTRLLLTKIPHFKDIIVMSFECPHCGFKNNEVQSAESISEKGQIWTCAVTTPQDLQRQLVRNCYAIVTIKELDLELPATGQTQLTTVEGLLSHIVSDLSADQPVRKHTDPQTFAAIDNILTNIAKYLASEAPFTLSIDDPSGNSYIESFNPPLLDDALTLKAYTRTDEQDVAVGIAKAVNAAEPVEQAPGNDEISPDEIYLFHANCSSCNAPTETRMKMVDIPHFKNVILMSTTCESCGYKSNEVKSGGAIMEKGSRITLKLVDSEDLSRDILKSETCGLEIPEIDLKLTYGTLGGRFTTVEGLLRQVHDDLNRDTPFTGDSSIEERREKFKNFLNRLQDAFEGKIFPLTLILDDPVSNSYIQNLYAPDPDPNMTTEQYERTDEMNEDLGLNDLKTENY